LLASDAATGESGVAGLSPDNNQLWHQDSPGVQGAIDGGEEFGSALAIGDFNDDGIGDLAIGVEEEDVDEHGSAGAVNVLYGTEDGISGAGSQYITEDDLLLDGAEGGDQFGAALAAGDFDGDGHSDLAIGVPTQNLLKLSDVGMVQVLYGTDDGLDIDNEQLWHQDVGIEGAVAANDNFGEALAAGDFNGDGEDDLAIGAPGDEIVPAGDRTGGVNVLYGSSEGLTSDGNQIWSQAGDIEGAAEDGEDFGAALTTGDFNDDGEDDLAVGVPGETVGKIEAGAANVIYGGPTGLTVAGDQIIHQDVTGVPGVPGEGDDFGAALASGDFNGDGDDDLAIGIPRETVGKEDDAGTVLVVMGSETGLLTEEGENITKLELFVVGTEGDSVAGQFDIDAADRFGASLAAGDFNDDGDDDLAAGAPGHDTGKLTAAGAVHVFFGSNEGISGGPNQAGAIVEGRAFYRAGINGILGEPEAAANFGDALAAGDLNDGGDADLAIGARDSDVDGISNAGAVHVIYGDKPLATDTPEPTDTSEPTDTVEPTDTPAGPTNTPTNTSPPAPTMTNTPPPGGLIGDVDCNGEVNAIDAAFILQFVAQLLTELPCPENADTNEDGEIDTIDAALILQFSAGLLGTLPP